MAPRASRIAALLALVWAMCTPTAEAFLAPGGWTARVPQRNARLFSSLGPRPRPAAGGAARPLAFAPLSAAYNALARGISGVFRGKEMGHTGLQERDVVRWLKTSGIDVNEWGKGCAKAPSDLLKEVMNGESVLSNGRRIVHVVKVVIRDGDYELVEARQVFTNNNGKIKERGTCLAEKFKPTEEPIAAALRGIREELASVVGDRPRLRLLSNNVECFVEENTSRSFPGLISQYQLYRVTLECQGLTRERTGMRFLTGEEGWQGKLHVWEWRKVPSSETKSVGGATEKQERELAGRVGARYF